MSLKPCKRFYSFKLQVFSPADKPPSFSARLPAAPIPPIIFSGSYSATRIPRYPGMTEGGTGVSWQVSSSETGVEFVLFVQGLRLHDSADVAQRMRRSANMVAAMAMCIPRRRHNFASCLVEVVGGQRGGGGGVDAVVVTSERTCSGGSCNPRRCRSVHYHIEVYSSRMHGS